VQDSGRFGGVVEVDEHEYVGAMRPGVDAYVLQPVVGRGVFVDQVSDHLWIDGDRERQRRDTDVGGHHHEPGLPDAVSADVRRLDEVQRPARVGFCTMLTAGFSDGSGCLGGWTVEFVGVS
jgi:hypothetical protein